MKWLGAMLVVGMVTAGCGGDDTPSAPWISYKQVIVSPPPAPPVCEAGRVATCPCAGGAGGGAQTCAADGSSWGACEGCDATTGTGGDGGAGGAPCVPKADPCSGLECGLGDDGCGNQVECPGHCAVGDVCTAGSCCHPTVVSCDGRCGPQDDGCGVLACDDVCGDSTWLTCDAPTGRCACQAAAGYPNIVLAEQACSAGFPGEGRKPYYCPVDEASKSDIPAGCKAYFSPVQPAGAGLYCCEF